MKNKREKQKDMKKLTSTKRVRTSAKKLPFLNSQLVKRGLAICGVVAFAVVGMYFLKHPFAQDPYGVTRADNELAVELVAAHSHAQSLDSPAQFEAPQFMLYGNGLLLCGQDSPSPKKGYELTTGMLSSSDIDQVVSQITKSVPDGAEEKAHTIQSSYDWPIEAVDQILVNYNKGAVEMRGNAQDHTPRFAADEALLHATCQKYAKTDFSPDKFVIKTYAATEASVSQLDEVSSSVSQPNVDGTTAEAIISRDEANAIKQMNQGNNYAKTHTGGKVYAVELVPVIPDYNPVVPSDPADKDKVEAASYLPTKWFWFYPSDKSLSSLDSEAATVSSEARAFYKQETSRDNSASAVVVVHGLHTDSWYKNTCPANFGCSSDKDLNAYHNIRSELQARTDSYKVPADGQFAAAYEYLYQGPSYRGANWCYGYANQPASVSSSRGDVAISFGFGSTSGGCSASANLRYATAAHELGHNLGLGHVCSTTVHYVMDNCGDNDPTVAFPTSYTVTSTQQTDLKSSSLFLNHLVYGRVVYSGTSTGLANVTITSCNTLAPSTVTNSTGYFSFRFPTRASYCLRMTAPSGYSITTQNNSEHSTATSYEYQLAGYNCYKQAVSSSCSSYQVTWDMASDLNKNFILVKNP